MAMLKGVLRNVPGVLCNVLGVLCNALGVLPNVLDVFRNVLGVFHNVYGKCALPPPMNTSKFVCKLPGIIIYLAMQSFVQS